MVDGTADGAPERAPEPGVAEETAPDETAPDGTRVDETGTDETPAAASAERVYLAPDPDRVARIVAALRAAHAAQRVGRAGKAAPAAETGQAVGAVRRASTGVRRVAQVPPALRWDPGARYRASLLAGRPLTASGADVGQVRAPEVPAGPGGVPPVPLPPVPPPPAVAAGPGPVPPPPVPAPPLPPVPPPPPLAGRLFRGPARRTAVFDREIWRPEPRSSRVPRDVGDALLRAVERYRTGSISTSGLVRAIAETHAA